MHLTSTPVRASVGGPAVPVAETLPHEVLFARCLSPQVKITLAQLAVLAEDTARHSTPPLTLPGLADLTGHCASTLRAHLAILQAYRAAVRLQRLGPGRFTLVLADWLFSPQPGPQNAESDRRISPQEASALAKDSPAPTSPINILINNTINQEEEEDPFKKSKEDLNPPPNHNNIIGLTHNRSKT